MSEKLQHYQKFVGGMFKNHEPLPVYEAKMLDWTLGLNEEAGEVASVVKHHVFHKEPLDKQKLIKECGDVLWYVTALLETAGLSLEEAIDTNIAKLKHRHGESYSHETSADRHSLEAAFDAQQEA